MSAATLRMRLPATATLGRAVPAFAAGAAMLGILGGMPVLHLAANRLVVGTPVSAAQALGEQIWLVAGLCLGGSGLLALGRSRIAALAALAVFSIALPLFAAGLGVAAADLVAGQPPAARARLASGGWLALMLLTGCIAASSARAALRGLGWLAGAALLVLFVLLARAGAFDSLSLAVEYRARANSVGTALAEHVVLSSAAVVLAVASSGFLYAWRRARGVVEIIINGLQVVPAVALLGGLAALASGLLAAVPSLREAGLSALGSGPAIVAITAYLLLPLWRGLEGALRAPDPATLDAAAAVGLTGIQILIRVQIPLGAPILIGALRVASVQSFGLATLGALVGAGGLGSIVFDGMAQFAPDLILLGALPVIGLSLLVERALSLLEDRVRTPWRP